MQRHTIELDRRTQVPCGYGVLDWDGCAGIFCKYLSETYIMNLIIDFSKDKNIQVYRHSTRQEFQAYDEPPREFQHGPLGSTYKETSVAQHGDKVLYLDIYYQGR